MTTSQYDFVIVGGGSAGCALANRLSADPANRVLVLEAGRNDSLWDVFIHMPAALAFPIGSRFYDWKYESEPEPHMGGRRIYHARGKVLGGSSSINGMIFQRGNPMDYERWAGDAGMETWDHAHCLPYFKRMETASRRRADDPFRGHDGPLVLERGPARGPLFDAFFKAVQEAGYPLTEDVNGYRQEGFAKFDRNVHDGEPAVGCARVPAPGHGRPNLDVKTHAFVSRIVTEGGRAVGVEFTRAGRRGSETVRAGEVLLCGGAINSPQLLQLSGIGGADELRALGIDVVADLPGVGENLQDHLEVYIQHEATQPVTMAPYFAMKARPKVGLEWLLRKSGPGATNHFEAGGFVRSNDDVPYPNLMYHFLPIAVRYDGTLPEGGGGPRLPGARRADVLRRARDLQDHQQGPAPQAGAAVQLPLDRPGPARVGRGDPRHARDPRRAGVRAVQRRRDLARQGGRDRGADPRLGREGRRDRAAPVVHREDGHRRHAVVDPLSMRVHGVDGLRVVDASVFPYVTNGNIYAPMMMTAEKAADLILGNTPLTPEPVPFYRHGQTEDARAPAATTG